jgi:predicted CopG family antitoxin
MRGRNSFSDFIRQLLMDDRVLILIGVLLLLILVSGSR